MSILIVCCTFLFVTAASYWLFDRFETSRQIKARLNHFFPRKGGRVEVERQTNSGIQVLGRIGRLLGVGKHRRLEMELAKAGIQLTAREFTVLRGICVVAPLLLVLAGGRILPSLALATLGAVLPRFYLKTKQAKRASRFAAQIPDALVMIANALKAGHSFLQAAELVSLEMAPPISQEFARALKEMNLGATTEDALVAMVERVSSEDFDLVITAVLIQRQVGGNLAEILDSIAYTIRERIRIRGEIKTLTAQGRISGIVISMLPVGIGCFIFVLNPGYIAQLFTDPIGQALLGAGLVGQVLAAVCIRAIVSIQV